jgi:malate dehydrogenase (oxaloacetate-decarboxylating)(NADP+)
MDSGIADNPITDWAAYNLELQKRIGIDQKLMSHVIDRAKRDPKRVVFAEATHHKILKAAQVLKDEGIAHPILLGDKAEIEGLIKEYKLDLEGCTIIHPRSEDDMVYQYADVLYKKRQRRGVTYQDCLRLVRERNYFGSMMVEMNDADALVSGLTKDYPKTISPALQVIGVEGRPRQRSPRRGSGCGVGPEDGRLGLPRARDAPPACLRCTHGQHLGTQRGP